MAEWHGSVIAGLQECARSIISMIGVGIGHDQADFALLPRARGLLDVIFPSNDTRALVNRRFLAYRILAHGRDDRSPRHSA